MLMRRSAAELRTMTAVQWCWRPSCSASHTHNVTHTQARLISLITSGCIGLPTAALCIWLTATIYNVYTATDDQLFQCPYPRRFRSITAIVRRHLWRPAAAALSRDFRLVTAGLRNIDQKYRYTTELEKDDVNRQQQQQCRISLNTRIYRLASAHLRWIIHWIFIWTSYRQTIKFSRTVRITALQTTQVC